MNISDNYSKLEQNESILAPNQALQTARDGAIKGKREFLLNRPIKKDMKWCNWKDDSFKVFSN